MSAIQSEAAQHAEFSKIRYAQVWEDADVLLEALQIQPGDRCFSIASAGDNALAMLTRNPESVVAVDLNFAQLACLEIRVAAFRHLEYPDLLTLIAGEEGEDRLRIYDKLRSALSIPARDFWDQKKPEIEVGIGHAGKFERYFRMFRRYVIPLVHPQKTVKALFEPRTLEERTTFYEKVWNNRRWQLLFRLFFSRKVMGAMGRDPSFFRYVEGPVAEAILKRTRHALVNLAPHENPYLQWILFEKHASALPCYLRKENFETIRANLDRLEWRQISVEQEMANSQGREFTKWNLSDIFEYMSEANSDKLLTQIAQASPAGSRLAYWNMLAPRRSPEQANVRFLEESSQRLHLQDHAFFYSAFVVEEVL